MTLHYWIDVFPGCDKWQFPPTPTSSPLPAPPSFGWRRFKIAVEIPEEPALPTMVEEVKSNG